LEAITFALFGEATFGGKAYKELSTDGNSEISVRMHFSIGDDRYQLVRTVAPTKSGGFVTEEAWIRRVDDDDVQLSHKDGVRAVDAEIRRLLGGMDREQFCQAVLLAQNRFALLLEADERTRNQLLDILLGLTTLEQARKATLSTQKAAKRNLERLEDRRSHLPRDPVTHARAARQRADTLTTLAKRADASARTLGELSKESSALADQARILTEVAALRIAGVDGSTRLEAILTRLIGLVDEDERIAMAISVAEGEEAEAKRVLELATTELARIEADHGKAGTHPVVATLLNQLAARLGERPANDERLAQCEEELAKVRIEFARAKELEESTALAADASRKAEQLAADRLTAARNAHAARKQDVVVADETAGRLIVRVGALEQALPGFLTAMEEVETAHAALKLAESQHQADSAAVAIAERASYAAAAAHECHPGEPCPVCNQQLPASWGPPSDVDLSGAKDAASASKKLVETAVASHKGAEADQIRTAGLLLAAMKEVAGLRDELVRFCEERALPDLPVLVIEASEDSSTNTARACASQAPRIVTELEAWREGLQALLVPLEEAASAAEAAVDQIHQEFTETQRVDREAHKQANALNLLLGQLEERKRGAQEAISQADRRIQEALDQLQEPWRSLVDVTADAPVDAAKERLTDDKAAVERAVAECERAEGLVQDKGARIVALRVEKAESVDGPIAALTTDLVTLTSAVAELAVSVEVPGPGELGQGVGAQDLLSAARALQTCMERATDAATTKSRRLQTDAAALIAPARTAVEELVALMREADPEGTEIAASPDPASPLDAGTLAAVQQLLGFAKGAAQAAEREARQAAADVAEAEQLDVRVGELGRWHADLAGAAEVLKKEHFPSWARDQRIAELVQGASELLSQMSGGRYRFDHRLNISDEINGVVRSAATLSGGEKFEAALALALGVAEIAGRSGIRFDTLFLDEGFAGLDQANLDRALNALETEVEAGRCIVLITHIGAVADRIQDVLYVGPDGLGGSKIRWLNEDERYELGADLDLALT
jgi:exonuclease SbcC